MPQNQDFYYKIRTCIARMFGEIYLDSYSNLQDSKLFSENIICTLLNKIYDYNLHNGNIDKYNAPGFDLIDKENKIIVQVSSQDRKEKVKYSLMKCDKEEYKDYFFYYFHLSLRKIFRSPDYLPDYIKYDKTKYYINLGIIIRYIYNIEDINKLKEISDYLESQYGTIRLYKIFESKISYNTKRLINFYLNETSTTNSSDVEIFIYEETQKLWDLLNKLPEKHRELLTIFLEKAVIENRTISINYQLLINHFKDYKNISDHEIFSVLNTFYEYGICSNYLDNEILYLNSIWEPIISLILSFTKYYNISPGIIIEKLQFNLFDEEQK